MSARMQHGRHSEVQEPRLSRSGNKVQLRYDVHHRLNGAKVYPSRSHRGSEVIVSAYEDGLHIIWRGGNPLRHASRTIIGRNNMVEQWNESVSIHEIDGQSGTPKVTASPQEGDKPAFEDEDEEMDTDEACPPIVQELKLSIGSPVLHLALPNLPGPGSEPSSSPGIPSFDQNVPVLMQTHIVVAVICADASVRLITLPLSPPSASAKRNYALGAQLCHLVYEGRANITPRAIALSWTPTLKDGDESIHNSLPVSLKDQQYDLVVAVTGSSVTNTLDIFRVPLEFDALIGGLLPSEVTPAQSIQLAGPVHRIAFNPMPHPSTKHSQILLADTKGSVKIYDFLASESSRSRPSSQHSAPTQSTSLGAWVISFDTPFHLPKGALGTHPGLARRKSILDACWVMAGRAVFVLLGDGEWGVWKMDGGVSVAGTHVHPMNKFAVGGSFLGERSEAMTAPEARLRSNQRLAPMTPNTRKVRQESLFSGPSSTGVANVCKGGISVAATTTSHGAPDESIVFWYGSQVYHITSLASIASGSNSKGRDLGSLYGPGLARLDNINLSGEMLSDIAQFPARHTYASVGNLAQRDVLVTGEYRFVIVSATRPQTPARSLFARDASSATTTYDSQLLQKGELDLNGMSRILDGMAGDERTNGFGKPKRVGFVR